MKLGTIAPCGTSRNSRYLASTALCVHHCVPNITSPVADAAARGSSASSAPTTTTQRVQRTMAAPYLRKVFPEGWFDPWIWLWQLVQERLNRRLLTRSG